MTMTATIGLDIAKQVFQVHGVDKSGREVLRRKLRRSEVPRFFSEQPPCLVSIEASGSAHYWARVLGGLGHTVRLMAPQFVKPYVKSQKNDANDAEAICEAVTRPNMRFVPQKTVEQQDLQCLHRVRSRLVASRTQLINQVRGLREECLRVSWFTNLFDARRKVAKWKVEYNEQRPQSSLNYRTPAEFARKMSCGKDVGSVHLENAAGVSHILDLRPGV